MSTPSRRSSTAARRYVSVIGPGDATPELIELAEQVGRRLAELGVTVVCGGLGGVMEAAAMGAREAGGSALGILPGHDRGAANRYLDVVVTTGMGEARNVAVVSTGEAVIAVGGAYGTLSEIGLAAKIGRPVVLLQSWQLEPGGAPPPGDVQIAATAQEAVDYVREWLDL